MKRSTPSPLYIVIASALYFLIASAVLGHNSTDVKISDNNAVQSGQSIWNINPNTLASSDNFEKK